MYILQKSFSTDVKFADIRNLQKRFFHKVRGREFGKFLVSNVDVVITCRVHSIMRIITCRRAHDSWRSPAPKSISCLRKS